MRKRNMAVLPVVLLVLSLGIVLLHGTPGRDTGFKKVLEFTDSGEDFYFKYPDNPYKRQLRVDKDGNIYILDGERILKFSAGGTYIKNLISEGEGPGEVKNLKNFFIQGNKITIYNHYPDKIIEKDRDGVLLKEYKINKSLNKVFAVYGKSLYSFDYQMPVLKGDNAKVMDIDWYLTKVSGKGTVRKIAGLTFPVKTFIAAKENNYGEIRLMKITAARLHSSRYYVSDSTEYGIKLLDLEKGTIVKTLKRDYKRQETPKEIAKKLGYQRFQLADKIYRRPPQEYLNDIQQLLVYKDSLWVVTSTVDEKKGVLVDEFDKECRFTGSFYLKLSNRVKYMDYFSFHAYIYGEYLYKVERDEEDNPWIVKYKILP